jgi:diacylglycerol kinase (ATP)
MAILPMGTGNDAARTLGLERDLEAVVKTAIDGKTREVDLIRVGDRLVLNAIGIGLTADINERAARIKGMRGISVYLVTAMISLVRFRTSPVRLESSERSLSSSMAILAVHNGPTTGGGFALTSGAVPDDGLFDVTLVPDVPFFGRLSRLAAALRGTLHDKPGTVSFKTRRLDLCHSLPLAVHYDGNPGNLPGPVTRFEIVPKALKVVVPRD